MVTALGGASHSHMRESKHALAVWVLHFVFDDGCLICVSHTSAALSGGKILLDAVTSTFL